MANRAFFSDNDGQFLEKRRTLYAVMDFGSSGAVTLKTWTPSQGGVAGSYSAAPSGGTQGIASVAKQATGKYLITLQDGYQRTLGLRASWQAALSGTTPVPPAARSWRSSPTRRSPRRRAARRSSSRRSGRRAPASRLHGDRDEPGERRAALSRNRAG
jgi:hypothetical protein